MGRGQRHSKNAGSMGAEAPTYHELRGFGYGTVRERLGKVGAALWHGLPGGILAREQG